MRTPPKSKARRNDVERPGEGKGRLNVRNQTGKKIEGKGKRRDKRGNQEGKLGIQEEMACRSQRVRAEAAG